LIARDRLLRYGYWAILGLVGVYLLISAFEPLRMNWGDPWSDSNAMTSGGHFAREGFIKLQLTPRVDVGPIGPDTLVYTHYPPLPDLVNGVLQKVSGGDHLTLFRIFALILSALSLYFMHSWLRRLWGGRVAKLSVVAMATSLLWLQYADTLHHIPLYTSTGFAILAGSARWLDEKRPWQLACVCVATFFCFLASYDYYFFVPILLLATIKWRGERIFSRRGLTLIVLFGMSGVLSIVVKNLLAIWAVGVHEWYRDIIFQYFERASHVHAHPYKEGLGPVVFWRLWRFFSPLIYVCGLIQFISLIDRIRGRATDFQWQPLVVLLAGAPFVMIFSQLFVEQYHPTLLFLPFAAISLASVVASLWDRSKLLAAAMFAFYLGWQGFQLRLFKKTFLYEDDVVAVRNVLKNDHHGFLMTNMLVDAPTRYYWGRYAFGLIAEPSVLHEYFEIYGADSPMTLVQIKNTPKHAYDKGVYMYFVGEKKWSWISRPDYYRNTWSKRFEGFDKDYDKMLANVGRVVYESKNMRVRQVTLADVEPLQRAKVPRAPVSVIDFETLASEDYKLSGISTRVIATPELLGYAWLRARQPTRVTFTLQGFGFPPTGEPKKSSELLVPMPAGTDVKLTARMSSPGWFPADVPAKQKVGAPTWMWQTVTISVNGTKLATRDLFSWQGIVNFEVKVPAHLITGDLQRVTFDYTTIDTKGNAARLHQLEIAPGTL
jgi:hypothetical protein